MEIVFRSFTTYVTLFSILERNEWKFEEYVFLGLLGYDINNVPLIQNLYGNQTELPTVAKKKKEADVGSDSVENLSMVHFKDYYCRFNAPNISGLEVRAGKRLS